MLFFIVWSLSWSVKFKLVSTNFHMISTWTPPWIPCSWIPEPAVPFLQTGVSTGCQKLLAETIPTSSCSCSNMMHVPDRTCYSHLIYLYCIHGGMDAWSHGDRPSQPFFFLKISQPVERMDNERCISAAVQAGHSWPWPHQQTKRAPLSAAACS